MSIIQTIRDKGAAIVISVIALSLIGFLLMDARSGAARGLFGGNTTTIGTINGQSLEADDFNTKVKTAEQQYANQNAPSTSQIVQNVWDQVVGENIVNNQFKKLGLDFTAKEMSSIMFSDEAPQQLKQAFTDQKTGQYDIAKAQQWWTETKKSKNEEQREVIENQVINPMRLQTLYTKYTSMISGSVYMPSWLLNKDIEEENSFANISYISVPYSDISDSTIKVSDNDIDNYIDKNKLKYKQEKGLKLSYVLFSASPSKKDTEEIKKTVNDLKVKFEADTNAKSFIARNTSSINYFDGFTRKSKMQMPDKDSIIALQKGNVFGPYLDGANYVMAKMVEEKEVPDSAKCRHILVKIADKSGQIRPDSVARKLIDSIATAIQGGADFNQMVLKYSDDEGSKNTKGEYTFSADAQLVDSFYQTVFYNPVGTKKIVKGESQDYIGYHYIEVLDQSKFEPAYKVAYMAREIVPSDETINAANAAATKLSGQARNEKEFDQYVKDNGLNKVSYPGTIKENDYQLGGIQDARPIIKWAFTAKEGDVSEPFSLKNQFAVAIVSEKIKEGTPNAKNARILVESIIRNNKKAEEIKNKIGNPSSLEAAAKVYNKQVLTTNNDSTLVFNAIIINGIGNEPKVAGAAFDKEYQNKVSPVIEGNTGVFVIKVNSISAKPALSAEALKQFTTQKMMEVTQGNQAQQVQGALGESFNALKKMADIKDMRSKFY